MERQIRYYRKPSRAQKVEILYCEELLAKNKEQGVHNCAILFNVPYKKTNNINSFLRNSSLQAPKTMIGGDYGKH